MSKYFITGNRDKWSRFLASVEAKSEWQQADLEIVEIQGATAKQVAEDKAKKAWESLSAKPGDLVLVQDDFWELVSTPGWPGCSMANTKAWRASQWLALVATTSRRVTKTVAVTLYDGVNCRTEVTVYTGWVGLESLGSSGSVMDRLVCWDNGYGLTTSQLADAGQYEVVNYPQSPS